MNTSIHLALWEWFAQCAAITKLFFNFSGTEDADTVISTSGDVVMESYIDGSQRRRYSFELIRYLPTTALEGVNCDFPFPFVAQWYEYQEQFINALDLAPFTDTPLYRDSVKMWEVIPYKHKVPVSAEAQLRLYGDRIEVGSEDAPDFVFPFDQTGMVTVLGKNKINLYFGDKLYQFKGSARFNALRYVNIFHHYLNGKEGAEHGQFLGL